MEQTYNISGTHEELQLILEKEFNISAETALVATAVFVYEQNQEQNHTKLEEDTLWFLNGEKAEYQQNIFSTRYTISFSKAMLDVLDELLVPGFLAVCGAESFAVLSEVLICIKVLIKNLRRIKDDECCVYFQAIKYLKNHSDKWFSAEKVMPPIGPEFICINLDQEWKCKFRCGDCNENCNIKKSNVEDILDTFCTDNIMESNEYMTLYKFKA